MKCPRCKSELKLRFCFGIPMNAFDFWQCVNCDFMGEASYVAAFWSGYMRKELEIAEKEKSKNGID